MSTAEFEPRFLIRGITVFQKIKKPMSTVEFEPSNLRTESSIDYKCVALATQAHQHLLKKTMFNFINYVKVKWSI